MLDYSILMPGGILDLEPRAPLTKDDFGGLDAALDPYLSNHDKLRGVLIHSKALPGWEDFDAFAAHMRFVLKYQAKGGACGRRDGQPVGRAGGVASKALRFAEVSTSPTWTRKRRWTG
jgi:hypothetical protein